MSLSAGSGWAKMKVQDFSLAISEKVVILVIVKINPLFFWSVLILDFEYASVFECRNFNIIDITDCQYYEKIMKNELHTDLLLIRLLVYS